MSEATIKEIIQVSDAIRQKYLSLKRGLADTEHALQETFKPIVGPLETLVKQSKRKIEKIETNKIKLEEPNIDEIKQPYKKKKLVNVLKDESIFDSDADRSVQDLIEDALTTEKGTDAIQSYLEEYGPIAKKYMALYVTNDKSVDKGPYGLRYEDEKWKIGNANVTIENNDFEIDGEWYKGTIGLYELIFMKNPDESKIIDEDLKTYREIINKTNLGRRNYDSQSQFSGSRSHKYKTYIVPTKTGKGLKRLVKAKPHYVYWDDINELVTRLKLLVGSSSAGHTGHENEILSLLEELREANVIE